VTDRADDALAATRFAPCDVLAIGPHPDDVEIGCGGTLLLLRAAGRTFAILDLTRGEAGSRGSAVERAAEAAEATRLLGGCQRHNLGLPDTGLRVDDVASDLLVAALRSARPRVLLAPLARDVHPDHVAGAQLCDRAWFLAGLRNHRPELGPPHRPPLVLRYLGNQPVEPSIVVDIGRVVAEKRALLQCYRSQLAPPDTRHIVTGRDVLGRAEVRDQFFGSRIGKLAGEAYWHDGPLALGDLGDLLR
jgi:bacillithiol biosynthesis deacetylase BshB1